jgi:hypothetical protein
MIKHIKIFPLLAGIVIGIIAVLFVKPEQKVNYKYPNPESKEPTIYKDKNGVCYRYNPKKVDCDKNEAKLKEFPLSR